MDNSLLALLMYLDEGLVTNLSSLLLSGYINVRTTKLIQDRTLSGNAGYDWREHRFNEDRCGEDEKDGFKGSSITTFEHCEETSNAKAFLENREFVRREEEFQRIYTTFALHSQLRSNLESSSAVKHFDNITINENDVLAGDYIEVKGELTNESVNSYIDSLLTVFNCFGCESLNKIIPSSNKDILNFTSMESLLKHLNEILNKNSTQDLILNCGDTPIVLNVNSNFFMNNNAYVYDRIECPCTVFGKVIKVVPNGKCVSLLRKTAQSNYYEKLLDNCCPYCDMLSSSGIIIPEKPKLKCEGVSLVVVPISIYM